MGASIETVRGRAFRGFDADRYRALVTALQDVVANLDPSALPAGPLPPRR